MLGAGTQENPYIIQTPADLQAIRNNLSAYYELANDIDMTGVTWTPIAPDSTNRFTGTIDGKGHKILNFSINDTTKNQQAFIIWTNAGATFKNIGFENAYVKGKNYNCVFVARPYLAVFENCYVRGKVKGASYNAGFSYASSSTTYRNCFADVTVTGSYAAAFVSVDNNQSFFERCYSNANVPFIQKPHTNSRLQITYTTYSYCLFNKTKYNETDQNGLTGLTDTQMKQQSSFVGWDFENIWYMPENDYPELRAFLEIKKQTINLQSYNLQSYINTIQSNITKTNKSTKQIQSYINTIQSNITKTNELTKQIQSYINTIQIQTQIQRHISTKLLSYVDSIQSNISAIASTRNKAVNAYISVIENHSSVQFEENLSNIYAIENPSTVEGGDLMAFAGDTVRLKCHFKTFDGQSVNPADVKLTIYDANKQQIKQIALTDTNKESNGVYFYDYVLSDDKQEIIFEFSGLYNKKPIVARQSLKIQFNK